MSTITVFVNDRPVAVTAGATALDAIGAHDPSLAARLAGGSALATDARGIELPGDSVLRAGAILRVVIRARRGADADA